MITSTHNIRRWSHDHLQSQIIYLFIDFTLFYIIYILLYEKKFEMNCWYIGQLLFEILLNMAIYRFGWTIQYLGELSR